MSDFDTNIENSIIKYLYLNKTVRDKVVPYFNFSIFELVENIEIMKYIKKFMEKYGKFPTPKETKMTIQNPELYEHLKRCINIDNDGISDEIMLEEIETYIKEKCVIDVIVDTMTKVQDGDIEAANASPDLMREALAFSFDDRVGIDIFSHEDEDSIFNFLHNREYVLSSGLKDFDALIGGGFHEKSLTLFMAETNMGKSLIMTALASNNILQGKNVLYVTYEMSEYKITERVLANIFDVDCSNLDKITKKDFSRRFDKARNQVQGKFIVKEYATKGGNVNNLRSLSKELKLKKKFTPDIIYIDYLGIMASATSNRTDNTYTEIKRITEEVRGLAVELGIPIVSAIQTNRDGFGNDSLSLSNASDSIGTVYTADLVIAVTQSESLREDGKYLWTLQKNRYGENQTSLPIRVNYPKMRLSNDSDDDDRSVKTNNNNTIKTTNNDGGFNDKRKVGVSFE